MQKGTENYVRNVVESLSVMNKGEAKFFISFERMSYEFHLTSARKIFSLIYVFDVIRNKDSLNKVGTQNDLKKERVIRL